jgi:hypothetical protein
MKCKTILKDHILLKNLNIGYIQIIKIHYRTQMIQQLIMNMNLIKFKIF